MSKPQEEKNCTLPGRICKATNTCAGALPKRMAACCLATPDALPLWQAILQAQQGNPFNLTQRFSKFGLGIVLQPGLEGCDDFVLGASFDRQDEREAEARLVGVVERCEAPKLVRR